MKIEDKIRTNKIYSNFSVLFLPLISIIGALLVGSIVILVIGKNPLEAYKHLFNGAFGGRRQIAETIVNSIPLMFTGLAITVAFRASTWNIGGEGQLYMGAVMATWAGTAFEMPIYIHIPFALFMGILGGMLWGFIPGILKAKKGLNEVIVTLLLNYIAIWFTDYLLHGPLQEPGTWNPQSEMVKYSATLPIIMKRTSLHAGLYIALIAAVFVYILLWKSNLGFKIRMVGGNAKAAENAGVKISSIVILTMLISGGLAGLGGAVEILGKHYRLLPGFSPGYGFDAIAVAVMGRTNPFGTLLAAIFFGALRSGATVMQAAVKIPVVAVYVIQGLVILFIVAGTTINWKKIKFWKKGGRG